jgi:hypothetical protein
VHRNLKGQTCRVNLCLIRLLLHLCLFCKCRELSPPVSTVFWTSSEPFSVPGRPQILFVTAPLFQHRDYKCALWLCILNPVKKLSHYRPYRLSYADQHDSPKIYEPTYYTGYLDTYWTMTLIPTDSPSQLDMLEFEAPNHLAADFHFHPSSLNTSWIFEHTPNVSMRHSSPNTYTTLALTPAPRPTNQRQSQRSHSQRPPRSGHHQPGTLLPQFSNIRFETTDLGIINASKRSLLFRHGSYLSPSSLPIPLSWTTTFCDCIALVHRQHRQFWVDPLLNHW